MARWVPEFDVVVIGSGFGGAVTACRLAQKNYKVLVLERGRRWETKDFPRTLTDAWRWDSDAPDLHNGWFELRGFPRMTVAQGAGVGGGSLVYANVAAMPPEKTFEPWNGFPDWPRSITWNALQPYLAEVGRMMQVRKVPQNQWPPRTHLMRRAAEQTGNLDRFELIDLAIQFREDLSINPSQPPTRADSQRVFNTHQHEQGTCYHCGFCDIGCDVDARNTLDKNYLHVAEKNYGTEIRPLHRVTHLSRANGGYEVHYRRVGSPGESGVIQAPVVILAAGSLGSTELLLRCRDEQKTLPQLSPNLGKRWSSNGDFLTPAVYEDQIWPSLGPTITSAVNFHDRMGTSEPAYWIQDGGFPELLQTSINELSSARGSLAAWALLQGLQLWTRHHAGTHLMPWFAQGIDAADGVLRLKRRWCCFGKRRLHLDWDPTRSRTVIDAILKQHVAFSKATGGLPLPPLGWTASQSLVTPHPLGGCAMSDSEATGVVDDKGQVFQHPGLYVADGAVFPRALGVNPSRTIAALAERIAEFFPDKRPATKPQ